MLFAALRPKTLAIIKGMTDRQKDDSEVFRKVVLLNVVCLIGIFVLIPMGLLAFWQTNFYLGCFDLTVAALLSCNLFYLNKTINTSNASYIGIICASLLFWFLVFTGGVNNTAFVWIYTFPLFAMFLLGSKKGLVANLLFFVPIVFFLIVEPQSSMFTIYSKNLKMRIIPSFLVVLVYSYLFEFMRERSYCELITEVDGHHQTAEKLHEAKIISEKANQTKSDFLANMSHELRTPLNHIIGFTELVLGKHFGDLNDTQEEYLNDVHQSSHHLLSLINDILDISKVEAGKLKLEPTPVNLRKLLESSLTIVKEKANKHGINLAHDLDEIPDTIIADERKLKQIIYNLLSNAVKFTPDQGKVQITAQTCNCGDVVSLGSVKGDRGIKISVIDTGIGIEATDIERIFNPFEQAEITKNKHYQGTGLGLALTKHLVELHGGTIWVESDGENKGCNFSLIIPAMLYEPEAV